MIKLLTEALKRRRRNRLMRNKPIPDKLPKHLKVGIAGENAATALYIKDGFDILERNYRLGKAEVDIIAEDKHCFVFCEVKSRIGSPDVPSPYGRPSRAVDKEKREHMIQAATYFACRYRTSGKCFRFDVVEVYLSDSLELISLHHIKSAFTLNR